MKRRQDVTYKPATRPRHPVAVAELNDAQALRVLVATMDERLDELTTAGARSGIMHARTILIGAINRTI